MDRILSLATCAGLVLVTRTPLSTRYLLNWDAVQFALGLRHFDLAHHQPHPPGYIGYLALGKFAETIFPDPNVALISLSIAAEAAGVMVMFLFADRVFGRFAAWVSALALLVSPLYWYYGEAANTYALEPVLTLVIAWYCWRLWNRDGSAALPAAVAVGLAGAVRPSTMVLLAPLFVVALWRGARWAGAVRAALLCAGVTLAWVVPLLVLSGGVASFLAASVQLGSSVTAGTAIWAQGLYGLEITVDGVARGLGWELGAFVLFLLAAFCLLPLFLWKRADMPAGWWSFCLAWSLPGLATFLLIHIGQVVYVQVFTGALFLSLGPAVVQTLRAAGRSNWAGPAVAIACLFNVVTFFVPPRYSLAAQLQVHDQQTADLIAAVTAEDPSSTLLLSDASGPNSYRTAQYYLPEFHRAGVGRDRGGWLGEVYGDQYDLGGYRRSTPLAPPVPASTYVILDRQLVVDYIADPERLVLDRLSYNYRIYFWHGSVPRLRLGELWLGPAYRERRGTA